MCVIIFSRTGTVRNLPRKPDNLASVAVYLAGKKDGNMMRSFAGLSIVGTEERDNIIEDIGASYSLGFVDETMEELRIDEDLGVT